MEIIIRNRLTTLTDEQLAYAPEWFASHTKAEQRDMLRRARAVRRNFGIRIPPLNKPDEWATGENMAALCYDDYLA
ncbi:hypothetical protein ACI2JN_25110 [Ochrobactrum teleogrylli]|uniref:hypothetical protein n=1 Tax=Ochrobactrum teleogrylli TaxID=2479765 RepID=UPI00384D50D0